MTSTLRVHDRAASSVAQGYGYDISGGECFHSFQLCLLPVGTTCVIHIVWSNFSGNPTRYIFRQR
eukprot:COSAG03_NODE_187_length_10937_cov_22.349788_7_plen_65_part_00